MMRRAAFLLRPHGSIVAFMCATTMPGAPADWVASSTLTAEPKTVWAGQVFDVSYDLGADRARVPQFAPTPQWNTPLLLEAWAKPELREERIDDRRLAHLLFKTRAIAITPGTLRAEPARHLITFQKRAPEPAGPQRGRMEQIEISSNPLEFEVRALPPPPAGFSEAVGEFSFTSNIAPREVAVGEPITWTLVLAGTGNWPVIAGLPAREVSTDFTPVQPMHRRTRAAGKIFDATLTEDVVLIPSKPGHYTLPPIALTCFDPTSGSYKTLTAPGATIAVTSARAGSPPAAPPEPSGKTRKVGGTREKKTVATPGAAEALRRANGLQAVRASDSPPRLHQLISAAEAGSPPPSTQP